MARRSLSEHDISGWNPMSQDYYDPNFNNYVHGPGSRLDRNLLPCHPRSDRENALFKLYVYNIPATVTETGLMNVFLHYGNPLKLYRHPTDMSRTWALVSYATHREAEFAIRELDSAPPFYFRVKFAQSAADKERIRRQREDDEMLSRALQSEPYPVQSERSPFHSFSRGIGRGRGIPLPRHMGRARCPGMYGHNAVNDTDMDNFSSHVPGAYDETNRMIMEQKMNHSFSFSSGERCVMMGRGYFPASKETSSEIDLKKQGNGEKCMLHQTVEEMYNNEDVAGKNCSYCHRMAFKYCQQCCLAWYCTKSCQQKDWPYHRTFCIPELSASDAGCDAKQSPEARSEKSAVNQASGQNIKQGSEHVSPSVDSGQVKPVGENMPNLAALSQDSLSAQEVINMYDAAVSAAPKMESLNISSSTTVGCSKSEELPKDRFTMTSSSAVHVGGEQYELAAAPLEKKQQHTNSSPQRSDVMKQTAPRTSESNTPMKCTPDKSLPRPKQSLRSVVDGLKVGMQGGGEFKEKMIGGDYSLTIIYPEVREKFLALFERLAGMKDAHESSPVDEKYSPNIGDMVLAPTARESAEDSEWNRAHILSVGKSGLYRVSFCDIGCTGTVKAVKQLSQELASIPEFAARCSIISCTKPKANLWSEENRQFLFMVTGVDDTQKAVTCTLKSKNQEEICTALLKRWVPAVEDEGLKTVELKNNDSVILQVFFNQKSLYVRPASSNGMDKFCRLIQDIGLHCMQAVDLDHVPVKNELVACRFLADGNYYRAKVLDVSADTVKVVYVDFGNIDCSNKDRLKPLTDSLKKIPCMVVKVGLKDALDRPLTVDANDFLSDLVGREVELKLILSGSRKDEVELILPDGSSVNDTLNTLLEPGWKRAMAAGRDPRESGAFMAEDMKYLELPVGQTVDFLLLHKLDSVTLMGCEASATILPYVHGVMTDEINAYCNSTPEKSYVPRYSELCFARFEDNVWYRAMCLGDEAARDKNVIFLDFGNLAYVEKENIRKMIKEYTETPAVAVMCTLQGLENANETQKNRVCELLQVNKTYKARVVSCLDPGNYVIEFPHVTEALIKENLLPSEK